MSAAPRVFMFDAHSHLYSGAQRTLMELASGGRGFTPIVAGPMEGPMLDAARSAGIEACLLAPPASMSGYRGHLVRAGRRARLAAAVGLLRYNLTAARTMRRLRADVVYCSSTRAVLSVGMGARLARRPVIWYVQQVDESFGRLDHVAARLSTRIAVITGRNERVMTPAIKRRHGHKLTVIPLGVADPGKQKAAAAPSGAAGRTLSMAVVGEITRHKAIDTLFDALGELVNGEVEFRLSVIGQATAADDLAYLAELHTQASRLGIAEHIDWLGYRTDVGELMLTADVLISPSQREGVPRVLMEAMFRRVPVIATDVGGVADLVIDQVTGLLVPSGDSDRLAEAIDLIARSPELRERLAGAGHAHVVGEFAQADFLAAFSTELCSLAGG